MAEPDPTSWDPPVCTYRSGQRLALSKAENAFVTRSQAVSLRALPDVPALSQEPVSPASTRVVVQPGQLEPAMAAARRLAPSHYAYAVPDSGTEFLITDRVLVRVCAGTTEQEFDALAARHGLLTREVYSTTERLFQLTDHSGMNPVKLVVAQTENEPSVELAANDLNQRMRRRALAEPTEALYRRAWHLHGHHDAAAVDPRASSRCAQAWQLLGHRGSPEVVIAVADDGCRLDHPDFNGAGSFVDWAYFTGSRLVRRADPDATPARMHQHGANHGNACAGVAAGVFTVGAAPDCRLLPVKWESVGPFLSISDSTLRSVLDLIPDKADILSNSWGTVPDNPVARIAVDRVAALAVRGGRRGQGVVFTTMVTSSTSAMPTAPGARASASETSTPSARWPWRWPARRRAPKPCGKRNPRCRPPATTRSASSTR